MKPEETNRIAGFLNKMIWNLKKKIFESQISYKSFGARSYCWCIKYEVIPIGILSLDKSHIKILFLILFKPIFDPYIHM